MDPQIQPWFTLGLIIFVFIAMARDWGPPDMVMFGAAVLLTIAGVIDETQLLAAFGHSGVITIAALFVIAGGLRETGIMDRLATHMFAKARTEPAVLGRMSVQVSLLSALLNNTAVVAMLLAPLTDWCRRNRVSPSRILLPLSFLTVLGGTITLIGTSTNVLVNGEMLKAGLQGMGLFDLAWVGVPVTVLGAVFLLTLGRRLLPNRLDLLEDYSQRVREYLVEMSIQPGCRLIGQTVQAAGLRNLPGLFLIEIQRNDQVIAPVSPDELLRAGDQLAFTGVASTIVDLERIPGFVPAGYAPADSGRAVRRRFCEAVVSRTSPLVGQTIRDSNFRARYNAAVIAVHRGGVSLRGRVGDIEIEPGDTLLLQTGAHFDAAHRNNPDFFLVSGIDDTRPARHSRAVIAGVFLAAFILLLLFESVIPVVVSALVIGGLMIVTRCISATDARRTVPLDLLLAIVGAIALGRALESSGLAELLARHIVGLTAPVGPVAAVALLYLGSLVMTEIVTNSAAAALMFPISLQVADKLGLQPMPFILAITYAASLGFATPFGYQTHLMVYGPGGYRFNDFVKVGLPMDFVCGVVVVTAIPLIWGFPPAT